MKHALLTLIVTLSTWLGAASLAHAETRLYTVAIGNNLPPSSSANGEALPTLKYADDDAAAIYSFFAPLSQESELLTVLDATSQARFPGAASKARPPSLVELRRLIARWKVRLESDRAAGHDPVVVFFFSGHGSREVDRKPALVMTDGPLSQDVLYDEILAALPARYVHLLVDACYAESVVRPRDAQAAAVDVGAKELDRLATKTTLARFPHVGAIVAASTTARTFEWDTLERGVFTHGLLSGLYGGADVNGDGRIEYSEMDAFLSAAHRGISDPRARLAVVAKPPAIDRRAPLVSLASGATLSTLVGAPPGGRFYLEDRFGNRVLDAHVEPGFKSKLTVPPGRFYLRVEPNEEARLDLSPGAVVDVSTLPLTRATSRSRGSVEQAIQAGFFATPFGPSYYRAFVDGRDELQAIPQSEIGRGVTDVRAKRGDGTADASRQAGWITLAGSGALGVATGVFGVLMLNAKSDYEGTSLEREASRARDQFGTYRTVTLVGSAVTTAALGTAIWLLVGAPNARAPRREGSAFRGLVW